MTTIPCTLGWANPDTGPENLRLYALDAGPSPRWAKPHARVAEQALRERGVAREGTRCLVIALDHLPRGLDDDDLDAIAAIVDREVLDRFPPP